jgi:predicted nucleic-acid-binding Zn-ribbon protein
MKIDDELAGRFVCPKCKSSGAQAKRFAAPGTGFSRLLDLQHNKYIAVSCLNCGFTELYDPDALEGKSQLGDVLDLIFGT